MFEPDPALNLLPVGECHDDALQLQRELSLVRMALRVGRLGAWRVMLPERELVWSEQVREIHEVEEGFTPSVEEALNFYTPESSGRIREAFSKCVEEGRAFDLELEIISAQGRRRWARAIGEAVRDQRGGISYVQGAFQDISELKAAEQRMQESARELANTLESIAEGFFTVDRQWRFTYVNSEAERLLEKTRDELMGKNIWKVFPDASAQQFKAEYERAIAENRPVTFRQYYPPYERWIEIRAYPSADSLAVYFKDVTKDHVAAEALRASEERFRLVSRATNDVIWDWNIVDDVHWLSDGFLTHFGYRVEELAAEVRAWSDRIHSEEREGVLQGIQQVIASGEESWADEYRFQRKDGTWAHVLDRGYVLRDASGKAVRMIGSMTDVSERRLAEQQIAEQAALLDNAQDAILVTDFADTIIYWNRGAERVFGYSRSEALGQRSVELLKSERARHSEGYSELIERGEWSGELKKFDKGNREIFLHTRWTLMRDEAGQPKSILAIHTDITEKKKLEAQFLRAQRMESIGTLAGGIAHDLNNVLAPIMMCLDMLELQLPGEEDRMLLATVQKSTQRGAELVRQVLSFARGLEGKRVPFKPTHILREVHKIARDTFPKNIQVSHSASAELSCVMGDPTQLHQVLMNLCVNARDAMPNGGALHLTAENVTLDEVYSGLNPDARAGRYVMINVADTGVGISPEIRERIFDPFFTTKELGNGTGLGLSTTLGIVKSHGGFIQVASEVGQGTMFSVYLPATASEGEESAERTAPVRLPQGNGETILVVDDEESVRTIASKTLERNGYRVLIACNGAEAVSLYATQRNEIAAVLTDMAMPIMDGAATVVALKSINRALPVIGSSGLANVSGLTKPLGSDLNAFIAKPYSAEVLLNTLQSVLTKNESVLAAGA
ncbi:MAG TPA: PAS domain S-box protein [Verrucomicrobiae bacterium]